jgi:O-antigen/teichoic acid export membrane protein
VRLRDQAFGSVRWTSLSSGLRMGLTVLQVAILARLLTPADFGLMAIAASLVVFLEAFADMGVSNAIIHHQETDPARLSSLYWLNAAAGAILALLVVLASPLIAAFYGEPALQPVLGLAALCLLLNALWQQLLVRAEMQFRFGALAAVQVTASAAGLLAAVAVALQGGGVFALAAGLVAQALAGAVLGWLLLAEGWRPRLRLQLPEIAHYLSFGAYTVGNSLANAVSSQIDILLGGKMLGAQSLGEYSVSKNLSLQIGASLNPIVTRVGLPLMARARREAGLLNTVYLQTIRMTASVNFPLHAALALFAPELTRLLLGPQWESIVPLVRVLAAWAMIRALVNPVGSLLMACGRADLSFRWNLGLLALTVPVVAFGSRYGQTGLALAMTALIAVALVAHWHFLVRPLCGAGAGAYLAQISVPLALAAAATPFAWLAAAAFSADVARLAAGLAAGAAAYLALSYAFNRAWLRALAELLRPR